MNAEEKRAYGRVAVTMATRRLTVLKQPIGVVGIITAWNFPAQRGPRGRRRPRGRLHRRHPPVRYTPMTAMEMVNILVEAGAMAS
jgi:hypothetical protein